VKIAQVVTLISIGDYAASAHWRDTRTCLHAAIQAVDWPPGSGAFTIYPESGKKRGEGNGVGPIKKRLISRLRDEGWTIEGRAKNAFGQQLGSYDAVLISLQGAVVAEWETGNVSSSHRSINKMAMLLADGLIVAGTLVVPTKRLAQYLTDRIGNFEELTGYWPFWSRYPCEQGILEVVGVEHDTESLSVPRIPKGTDGRSAG
jgi:hypothetical protein